MNLNEYLRIALMAATVMLVTACATAIIVNTPVLDEGATVRQA